MGISVEQYRISIGCHANTCSRNIIFFWYFIFPRFIEIYVIQKLIKLSNDVHSNPGPIKLCQANVQSLMALPQGVPRNQNVRPPKLLELETLCNTQSIDMLCISESWLTNNFSDDDIAIDGLPQVRRRDRATRGGGVAVYASNRVVINRLHHIEPTDSEILCLDVHVANSTDKHILLAQCYRPDDRDIVDFVADLMDIYDYSVRNNYFANLFIGDFNCKNSLWFHQDRTNTEGSILQHIIDNMNCQQMVNFPTRFRGDKASCLDLIICDKPNIVHNISSCSPVGKSDHAPILFDLQSGHVKNKTVIRHIWNHKKGDYEAFNRHLANMDWDRILDVNDIDVATNRWYDIFHGLAKLYVPNRTISSKSDDLPYMNTYLRTLMRTRDRFFKIYQTSCLDSDHEIYKQHRNKLVNELRIAESKYYENLSKDLELNQQNSKKWWKLLKKATNSVKGSTLHETPILDDDILIYEDTCKAEALNKFFTQSVQTENPDDPIPKDHNLIYYPKIPDLTIEVEEVYNLLNSLDMTKATGPDNISNIFLKKCALGLAKPLSIIFNLSLKIGAFPAKWKLANVAPIYKNKGDRKQCNFYRPISLLPCVSKVLEKILFSHIYEFLRKNKIIAPNQSGFTPGDSAIMQVSHIVDKMTALMDKGQEIIALFLDLAKAFDVVWRKGLLFKLDRVGIRDSGQCKLLSWFRSYLCDRQQCVVLNGKSSTLMTNNSGVPQGSVLGPLLFLIYINDLVHGLKCKSFLFADDTSLFNSGETIFDCYTELNKDLEVISCWAKKWKIKINADKTEGLIISRKSTQYAIPNISLDGCNVNFVREHKHVGVWLDNKLDWKTHIQNLANKANKRMGILRRFKYSLPRHALNQIYLSFVRPVMEYGGPLFAGQDLQDLEILDKIQIAAMHIVTGAKQKTSHELLKDDTNWDDLSVRRKLQQVTMLHKVIHKRFPVYLLNDLPYMSDGNSRLERRYKFHTPHFDHAFYRDSIIPKSITEWNSLPNPIRTNTDLKSFKWSFKQEYARTPSPLLNYGERISQMSHTRIRLNFSNLNSHLHSYNLSESPNCEYCNVPETPMHYLFQCNQYNVPRAELLNSVEELLITNNLNQRITLKLLLHGHNRLSYKDNCKIFDCVHSFIRKSGRNP